MPRKAAQLTKSRKRKSSKVQIGASFDLKRVLIYSICFIFICTLLIGKVFFGKFVSALSPQSNIPLSEDFFAFSYVQVDNILSADAEPTNINYVFVDRPGRKVIRYTIPTDLQIDVPGNLGVEKYGSLFRIATLQEKNNISLTNLTLFKTFGYAVPRYIYVDTAVVPAIDQAFWQGSVVDSLWHMQLYSKDNLLQTNFSIPELYSLLTFISGLPEDRIIQKEFIQNYIDQPSLVDEDILDTTFRSQISVENKSIAVLNGTPVSGTASFVSRVVQNMGGRVIAVENAKNTYETSTIIASDLQSSTVANLSQTFGINKIITPQEAGYIDEYSIDRADVTVILGFDVVNTL